MYFIAGAIVGYIGAYLLDNHIVKHHTDMVCNDSTGAEIPCKCSGPPNDPMSYVPSSFSIPPPPKPPRLPTNAGTETPTQQYSINMENIPKFLAGS